MRMKFCYFYKKIFMNLLPGHSSKPTVQLIWFLVLVFVSALFTYLLGLLLAIPLFTGSLEGVQSQLSQPASAGNLNLLLYFQFVSQVGIFVIPPLLFGWLIKKNNLYYFQLDRWPLFRSLFYVFLIAFTILPVINVLALWNQELQLPEAFARLQEWIESREGAAQEITQLILGRSSYNALAVNLFVIALIPAIGEELFFRGVLQKTFANMFNNMHVSIIVTSILFSALHMQFFGFLPRMLLGLLFGYYFYWSRSLWLPIFAHFINNGAAVVVAFLAARGQVDMNYEEFGNYNQQIPLIVLNTLLSIALLAFIYRMERKRKQHE